MRMVGPATDYKAAYFKVADERDRLGTEVAELRAVLVRTVRVIRKIPYPCPGHPMGPSEIVSVINAARAALAKVPA